MNTEHKPFVIQGDLEMLEEMGYKPFFPKPVEKPCGNIEPLVPIKLAYELDLKKLTQKDKHE